MRAALSIAVKDLRLLLRDRVALFWVGAFPLLFALLLGSVLEAAGDGARALPLQIVDEAGDARSRTLIAEFEQSAAFDVAHADLAAARDAVRRGAAVAFVRVTPRSLELGVDPSRRAEAATVEAVSNELARRAAAPRAVEAEPAIRVTAVSSGGAAKTGFGLAFPAAVLWGLMGCAASFAIATVAERSAGTLLRLRAAPVSVFSILGGKALACFLACVVDCALLVMIARLGFGVSIADTGGLIAAVLCASACFAGITLALGSLGRSEQSVAGAGWATLVVMAMLGGAMVPLAFMPEWLRRLAPLSPVKWGISALEGALWRGFSASELVVPCVVLLLVGMTAFVIAAGLMHRREA